MRPESTVSTSDAATVAKHRAVLLDGERRVLEGIADAAPIADVLHTLASLIEEQARGMGCAILLADVGQTRLRIVAAPSMTEDYRRGIEPYLRIAPDMASCGRAAFLKQPVYTRDTATDRLWVNCSDVAVRNGLRAVWSTPILADDNRVLGTFAMYYSEPRLPDDEHVRLIDMAVQLARVAIEARADDAILRAVFDEAHHAHVITDTDGRIVRANDAFSRLLGHVPDELRGRAIADFIDGGGAAAAAPLTSDGQPVSARRRYRRRDGRALWLRERSVLKRDPRGETNYVVTRVDKLSESADDPLERLSHREREVLAHVVAGRTSKEIAARMGVTASSVDTYRSRLMTKLEIDNLVQLVRFAIRNGIASA